MIVVIFTACKKKCSCDKSLDADDPACCETPITPTPTPNDTTIVNPHDSTYIIKYYFGPNDMDIFSRPGEIQKLIDSSKISEIHFLVKSDSWDEKYTLAQFMNATGIRGIFDKSSKVRGGETFKHMNTDGSREDSLWMTQSPRNYRFEPKPVVPPKPYDVTYQFGPEDMSKIMDINNIRNVTDSVLVRNLYFVSDGKSFKGTGTTYIINYVIKPAFDVSPKIKGSGPLKGLKINSASDSLWAVQNGFHFVVDSTLLPPSDTTKWKRTTYPFSRRDMSIFDNMHKVVESLDSNEVVTVYLKAEGDWTNVNLSEFINSNLRMAFGTPHQHVSKLRGAGDFTNITVTNEFDSLQAVEWGFTVNQNNNMGIIPGGRTR